MLPFQHLALSNSANKSLMEKDGAGRRGREAKGSETEGNSLKERGQPQKVSVPLRVRSNPSHLRESIGHPAGSFCAAWRRPRFRILLSLPYVPSFLFIVTLLKCDLTVRSHSLSSPHDHSTRHTHLLLISTTSLSLFLIILTSLLDPPASLDTGGHSRRSPSFMIMSLLVSALCSLSVSLFRRSRSSFTTWSPLPGYPFHIWLLEIGHVLVRRRMGHHPHPVIRLRCPSELYSEALPNLWSLLRPPRPSCHRLSPVLLWWPATVLLFLPHPCKSFSTQKPE